MKILLQMIFIGLFAAGTWYVLYEETERYESKSIINIRDLSKKQATSSFDMILSQASPVMQDSKLLELYIRSEEMFNYLDKEFNLTTYYASKVDRLHRLSDDAYLPHSKLTKENLVEAYNEDLFFIYDTTSTAIKLNFSHSDANISQHILKKIIEHSSYKINSLERENANVALHFLKEQVKESKDVFIKDIKKMIRYQNKHNTIDPNLDVKAKSTILANLEGELIKKRVEFQSSSKYMIKNSTELKIGKNTIENLKRQIRKVKSQIAGSSKGSKKELNSEVFDYELLKNNITFSKEIYSQSLSKLEELRTQVNQNIKNLVIILHATLPERYTYPNKPKKIFTLFIILFFFYSILVSILTLLRDYRD